MHADRLPSPVCLEPGCGSVGSQVAPQLGHGAETDVWGDTAYLGQDDQWQAVAPPCRRRPTASVPPIARVEHPPALTAPGGGQRHTGRRVVKSIYRSIL